MSEKDVNSEEQTETADPIDAAGGAVSEETVRTQNGKQSSEDVDVSDDNQPAVSEPNGGSGRAETSGSADELAVDEQAVNKFGFTEDEMVSDHEESPKPEEQGDENASPIEEFVEEEAVVDAEGVEMEWYILKVQVNREGSICDALNRRVKQAGFERFFGEILVPTENVKEFSKAGKQKIVKRKLYPGYVVVRMVITDDTWFLVRETTGIGDFTGAAGKPAPLLKEEIDRIIATTKPEEVEDGDEPTIKTAIKFKPGDQVRVKEGYFQNYEGEVSNIDERNGRITVMINIFGRPNPVELDHWQVESV